MSPETNESKGAKSFQKHKGTSRPEQGQRAKTPCGLLQKSYTIIIFHTGRKVSKNILPEEQDYPHKQLYIVGCFQEHRRFLALYPLLQQEKGIH